MDLLAVNEYIMGNCTSEGMLNEYFILFMMGIIRDVGQSEIKKSFNEIYETL